MLATSYMTLDPKRCDERLSEATYISTRHMSNMSIIWAYVLVSCLQFSSRREAKLDSFIEYTINTFTCQTGHAYF